MLLSLDFESDIPIYMQIRNQIILGISSGKLLAGEKLPTIRSLAEEIGVNSMTVNKAYQLLKQEGFITTDRRNGAMVKSVIKSGGMTKELEDKLCLLVSEAKLNGVSAEEFIASSKRFFEEG